MIDEDAARMAEQPCFALYSAVHAITRAYRPLLDPLGLTYPQFVVMTLLWEHDEIDQRTVAERARLDPATLTPLLKRLQEKGLLRRERSTQDERRLVITVTEHGRELQRQAASVPEEILCLVGLEPEQGSALIALCEQVIGTLNAQQSS